MILDHMKQIILKLTLLFSVTVGLASFVPETFAQSLSQDSGSFHRPLTLAPAEPGGEGGGGTVAAGDNAAELAKKLQNPVASLISVPIQNNWDFGIGPENAMRYTAVIEPVIPLTLTKDWNLITRTIMPVIYAESPVKGGKDRSGLGDITQSFFLSPAKPIGGWILAGGPALLYPSATDSALGDGKWGAGPTVLALKQQHGWTYGALANHIWSYAGWGDESISSTFLQPFVSFTTKKHTTFSLNTESSYDWNDSQWTVPLNLDVSQLVHLGKLPVQFELGGRYYAEKPDGGPDWGMRFTITFVFPEKQ
jgi:hypothetical protein